MCFLVGCYRLYLYTVLRHGNPSRFGNSIELYRVVNHYSMLMQVIPLVIFVVNLPLLV